MLAEDIDHGGLTKNDRPDEESGILAHRPAHQI